MDKGIVDCRQYPKPLMVPHPLIAETSGSVYREGIGNNFFYVFSGKLRFLLQCFEKIFTFIRKTAHLLHCLLSGIRNIKPAVFKLDLFVSDFTNRMNIRMKGNSAIITCTALEMKHIVIPIFNLLEETNFFPGPF